MDLISRQDAIDMFRKLADDDWNIQVSTTWATAFDESADMIEDLPSADVVEVLRCKDCRQKSVYPGDKRPYCIRWEQYTTDDAYCSWGERKE